MLWAYRLKLSESNLPPIPAEAEVTPQRLMGAFMWSYGASMGSGNPRRAKALHEKRQDTVVVGVASGHASSDGHGAVCADQVRIRGRPAVGDGR